MLRALAASTSLLVVMGLLSTISTPERAYAVAGLTLPSGEQEASTSFEDLCAESCVLSGFGATDEIRLVVTSEDGAGLTGKIRLAPGTSTTGLEAVTGYNDGNVSNLTADTYNELAFVGTQAEINAVLPELQYKGNAKGDSETVNISATLAGVDGRTLHYFPGTGHYYEHVDTATDWSSAKTAAEGMSFNGLTGYLVTILSKEENDFIKDKVTAPDLWMGAEFTADDGVPYTDRTSDRHSTSQPGAWEWVTGPLSDRVEFWSGTRTGTAVAGKYASWNTNQPDGSSDCSVTNFDGAGKWDDYVCSANNEYLVEYGGLDGESPTLELTSTLDVYVPYTVTYAANEDQHQAGATSGSVPGSVNVKAGSTYTVLGNTGSLARVGFTFEGWSTSNSSQTQSPDTSITVSADTTLYAQWGIPQAARLFGQEDDDGNRTEDVIDVTGGSGSFTGNVRGITTDGSFIYYLPRSASGSNTVWKVNFDGSVATEKTVSGDSTARGVMTSASSDTARADLAYSSGCIFLRGGSHPAFSTLYCIDTTSNDWSINQVTVPSPGIPAGQGWGSGSILDFPDGKLAVVGANSTTLGAEPAGYDGDAECPADHYCKILRIFEVSGTGSSVTLTHDQDILLADTQSNWPSDNHGIASDGTYLFQSHHQFGYKTWGLQPGVSYIVFNGDGNLDVDGAGGTYRASAGHNDNCGATTGVSGGFCPINPEVDNPRDRSGGVSLQMVNTTYFSRDHTNKRYIMGDYGAPRFLLTEAATDQPDSDFTQPAPTTPSSVTGSSANQAVTVSWGASTVSGGGTISYTVTSSPGSFTCTTSSTSCQVTGLTNGTSYTFSVVAKVGSVNSTAAVSAGVIPAVPSSGNSGSSDDDDESSPVVTPPSLPGGSVVTRGLPRPPVGPSPGAGPGVFNGPVIVPGVPRGIPSGPVTRFGGVPAPTQTTTTDDGLDVRSGGVNVGVRLRDPGTGGVAMNPETNQPELQVRSGGSTRLSGGGLQPGSTVQVWLPGVMDRELGRVSVGPDGGFDGEVALAHRSGEPPLPIGRQMLQVTGFDENGVETVIEMPMTIAQPAPTPEPNREVGALPDLGPRQSIATSAGIPTPVVVTPFEQQRSVAVDGGDWALNVALNDPSSEVSGSENEPFIRLSQSSTGEVSGDGFMPGTVASVWFFSEPTLMGTVTVTDDGGFALEFLVSPQSIPTGEHTLQIQGVGEDGYIKAANLGVLVDAAPAATTSSSASMLLWWIVAAVVVILTILLLWAASRRRRQAY